MKDLIEDTQKVADRFKEERKDWKEWNIEARTIDLMEEVGELSNSILVKENYKTEKRRKAELENSLADILFDLFIIAKNYDVNLEEEYIAVLDELNERLDNNEF